MKNLKAVLVCLVLGIISINLSAQVAPIGGKKVLEVKTYFKNEYFMPVFGDDVSQIVLDAMRKRVPKKLEKYGFNDITIIAIGQVTTPPKNGWAQKMSDFAGSNREVGIDMLMAATTAYEVKTAIRKMNEPEYNGNWKFQVNFKDNSNDSIYKVRLSMMSYAPQYIIKEETKNIK